LEQKWIDETQAKLGEASQKDLLKKTPGNHALKFTNQRIKSPQSHQEVGGFVLTHLSR
jgi:hypothetical protein